MSQKLYVISTYDISSVFEQLSTKQGGILDVQLKPGSHDIIHLSVFKKLRFFSSQSNQDRHIRPLQLQAASLEKDGQKLQAD